MDFLIFRKGSSTHLDGRLLAYAKVSAEAPASGQMKNMVHNGLFAVEGNYRDQRTLAEFFRSEFGLSLERGIEEVIEQSREGSGLESALDPELVQERLRAMRDAAGTMPIPAKVVPLDSEADAMEFDGDVVALGAFDDLSFAHMAVNAFPILYQARYRQQEYQELQGQIDALLSSRNPAASLTFEGDVEKHLLQMLLPHAIYAQDGTPDAQEALDAFRDFLKPHLSAGDLEAIINLLPAVRAGDRRAGRRMDLLLRRVAALHREDYRALEEIRKGLEELDAEA